MEKFEEYLTNATKKGSDVIPGAVAAVVDKNGKYLFKTVKGFNGVTADASPMELDQTYFLASCTKLITSIAAMQVVERGLVGLDDSLDKHLPELTSQPILTQKSETEFEFYKPTKSITLRHLVTHSSGASYDLLDPMLTAWRLSNGEKPSFDTTGDVAKGYAYPRAFEAGEGWRYGGGLDWASLLVQRLTGMGFEEYVETYIAKPLGITTFTWHLSRKPHVEAKVMRMTQRDEDGTLVDGPNPVWPEPTYEGGGAGLYGSLPDYMLVLADLLKTESVLLSKHSIEQFFAPQFEEGSNAQKAMYEVGDGSWGPVCGRSMEGVVANHALGGFITTTDIVRENYFKPKGTLAWSGMPNLAWNVNRELGLATMIATQVMPWNDEKAQAVNAAFETAAWKTFSKM